MVGLEACSKRIREKERGHFILGHSTTHPCVRVRILHVRIIRIISHYRHPYHHHLQPPMSIHRPSACSRWTPRWWTYSLPTCPVAYSTLLRTESECGLFVLYLWVWAVTSQQWRVIWHLLQWGGGVLLPTAVCFWRIFAGGCFYVVIVHKICGTESTHASLQAAHSAWNMLRTTHPVLLATILGCILWWFSNEASVYKIGCWCEW